METAEKREGGRVDGRSKGEEWMKAVREGGGEREEEREREGGRERDREEWMDG